MSKTFRVVTNIVIIVLAFLIILFTGIGIFEMADGMRVYTVSEDSMLYALEDGRYGDLVSDYHRNIVSDAKTTKTMEECYAIARYYEAAVDYKLALQENDNELLEHSRNQMDDASNKMGDFSYAQGEIDKLLEIE